MQVISGLFKTIEHPLPGEADYGWKYSKHVIIAPPVASSVKFTFLKLSHTLSHEQAVRSSHPLRPGEYFEMTIHEIQKTGSKKPALSIGLGQSDFPLAKQFPGWLPSSYGYHGDDGSFFHSQNKNGIICGIPFTSCALPCRVGCGISIAGHLYFTVNGKFTTYAMVSSTCLFHSLEKEVLYPIIATDTPATVSAQTCPQPALPNLPVEGHSEINTMPPELLLSFFNFTINSNGKIDDKKQLKNAILQARDLAFVNKSWNRLLFSDLNEIWKKYLLLEYPNHIKSIKTDVQYDRTYSSSLKKRVQIAKKNASILRPVGDIFNKNNLSFKSGINNKVVFTGKCASGKTAIVIQKSSVIFLENYNPTVEDSYRIPMTSINGQSMVLDVLDTSGANVFSRSYWLTSGDVFVIVHSVVEDFTEYSPKDTIERIARVKDEDLEDAAKRIILVGSKIDLVDEGDEGKAEKTREELQDMAVMHKIPYIEVSAKTNVGIDELFAGIVRQLDKVTESSLRGRRHMTK